MLIHCNINQAIEFYLALGKFHLESLLEDSVSSDPDIAFELYCKANDLVFEFAHKSYLKGITWAQDTFLSAYPEYGVVIDVAEKAAACGSI